MARIAGWQCPSIYTLDCIHTNFSRFGKIAGDSFNLTDPTAIATALVSAKDSLSQVRCAHGLEHNHASVVCYWRRCLGGC